jgi:acetyl esterase/lipase
MILAMYGTSCGEERVIFLYQGKPPGSELWTHQEKESKTNLFKTQLVYNVTKPSLTMFAPKEPNGTALIICPGGAFHCLSIDSEGNDVAKWLTEEGVTCFVLKYRLVECKTDDPALELLSKGKSVEQHVGPVVKLAMEDGLQAIRHVRTHAKELGVNPKRIGLMGFSAGGTLAVSVAYNYAKESRPDYLVPIYAQYDWALKKQDVPEDAPPIFILAATDDQLVLAENSVRLNQDWISAKQPAELHLYAKGGHGFGMRRQNLPTDQWIERFADWMKVQGLVD